MAIMQYLFGGVQADWSIIHTGTSGFVSWSRRRPQKAAGSRCCVWPRARARRHFVWCT